MTKTEEESAEKACRRLKGFSLHILWYFLIMFILVPLNIFVYNSLIWFVFPLVGWGSVLAIHAALVLGLFGHSTSNR
jgi:hypothetical protein